MDLTEAEVIKRWQEYTEERHKKDLHDPDNHDGVITHLEPDILECEVKWALGSITMNKASGGDGIPVELFQILNDDAVKVLQRHHFADKGPHNQSYGFLVVMYRFKSWTIKKAECRRIDTFKRWYRRRLLRAPWRLSRR